MNLDDDDDFCCFLRETDERDFFWDLSPLGHKLRVGNKSFYCWAPSHSRQESAARKVGKMLNRYLSPVLLLVQLNLNLICRKLSTKSLM